MLRLGALGSLGVFLAMVFTAGGKRTRINSGEV